MGDIGLKVGEGFLNIVHKRRTAGTGQKSLFCKLLAFCVCHHICAQRSLHHRVETQLLEPGYHLTQLCIGELAGNGGSNHCEHLVILVVIALFDHINHIENVGFVRNGAKGTLIHTGTAGNTLIIVNGCRLVLVHMQRLDLTCIFTRTSPAVDGSIGTYLGTGTAIFALGLVNMRNVLIIKGDGAEPAYILASVSQASPAGIGDLISTHRAFIAGNLNDLDHVGIFLIAPHCQLDTLPQNCPLLVYTAAHGRRIARHDDLRNIQQIVQQSIVPCLPGNLPKHLVL